MRAFLGTFQYAHSKGYLTNKQGDLVFYKCVLIGGIGGVIGQFASSPLFLVKTHLQSAAAQAIAVGHQHQHDGLWKALKSIYNQQGVRIKFVRKDKRIRVLANKIKMML